jgi:hypothetical protein
VTNVVYNTINSFCLREGSIFKVCPNDAIVTHWLRAAYVASRRITLSTDR